MIKKTLLFFSLTLLGLSLSAQKKLVLSNNDIRDHTDELVILKRNSLSNLLRGNAGGYVQLKDSKGAKPVVQFDDLNNDGRWDEAVFLVTLKAGEMASFDLSTISVKPENGLPRAHVRQRRKAQDDTFMPSIDRDSIPTGQANTDFSKVKLPPFLTEGPAWENDKVGFRLYFDVRNGKDIWGKTTPKMMMDTVGIDPSNIYHNRAAWGMDIYKVGSSLSAGALAMQFRLDNGRDTLIRLGGVNMGPVSYTKIADGPVRAMFTLNYPSWKYMEGKKPISLVEQISIWGGQFFYQSTVSVANVPKRAQLVTGFANFFQLDSKIIRKGDMATAFSFGIQSENKDNLGLAIMANKKDMVSFGMSTKESRDIKDSFLLKLKMPAAGRASVFRFYAGWEPTAPFFKNINSFELFLQAEMEKKDNPISMMYSQ